MKNIFAYSFKVWLFAVGLSSFVSYCIHCYNLTQTLIWNTRYQNIFLYEALSASLLMIVISAPFFLIFFLTNEYISKKNHSEKVLKLTINLVGVFLLTFPWVIFYGDGNNHDLIYFIILSPIFLTIGVWFFKIPPIINSSKEDILDEKI